MGKKKHKKHGKHDHRAEAPFGLPPHVAGIAAVAIEQVNSPAFRQMIAGALGAAAQAFDSRRTAAAEPAPPPPPVQPAPPTVEATAPTLSPEAAQAIERVAEQAGKAIETAATVAARALESASDAMTRWAAQQAQARGRTPPDAAHDGPDARPGN